MILRAITCILLISSGILFGCSSGQIRLNSDVEKVEVFARTAGALKSQKVGETPLNRPAATLKSFVGGGPSLIFEFKKNGYISKEVFLNDIDANSDVDLRVTLERASTLGQSIEADPVARAEKNIEMNKLIDRIFEAQRLIKVGRFDDATKVLTELKKTHPELAVLYELQGGLAYMNKDYNKALDEYSLAIKNNPDNLESVNLKKFLEKSLGRLPASPPPRLKGENK